MDRASRGGPGSINATGNPPANPTANATADTTANRTRNVPSPSTGGAGVVLVGAGDIAHCRKDGDEATAAILDTIPGTVFTTGDNAYPDGTAADFANCYHPSWGRHRDRTRPTPGNHDYHVDNAAGYFDYFGASAGERGKGYYSYDLGEWHVIALNSEINMKAGSPQERWLRADLAATTKRCVLAYMHRPRFSSSSKHGSQRKTAPLFRALYDGGVEVIVGGHDHTYERFSPQAPDGTAAPKRGVRQFVVGTGGRGHYKFGTPLPTSEVRYNETAGLIKFTLYPLDLSPDSGLLPGAVCARWYLRICVEAANLERPPARSTACQTS